MTYARTSVQDFSLANKIYVGGTVTFYTVLNGQKTSTKADVYNAISGGVKVSNPQVLDNKGKFRNPVYIQQSVIMTITGLGNVPDHDTGIITVYPLMSGEGSPEGVVEASVGTIYTRTNGGANTTLYVKESGTDNTGWVGK